MSELRTSRDRASDAIRSKLEVLTGERGSGGERAVRVKDLLALTNSIARVALSSKKLASKLKGAQATFSEMMALLADLIETNAAGITALNGRSDTLEGRADALEADLTDAKSKLSAAHLVEAPTLSSATTTNEPPTAAEFNQVVADIAAIRSSLAQMISALG